MMAASAPDAIGTVERKETGIASHHLDKEKTFVGSRCIADLVDTFHNRVECSVITDSGVGAVKVIVYRADRPMIGIENSLANIRAPVSEPSPPITTRASMPRRFITS